MLGIGSSSPIVGATAFKPLMSVLVALYSGLSSIFVRTLTCCEGISASVTVKGRGPLALNSGGETVWDKGMVDGNGSWLDDGGVVDGLGGVSGTTSAGDREEVTSGTSGGRELLAVSSGVGGRGLDDGVGDRAGGWVDDGGGAFDDVSGASGTTSAEER